MPQVPATVVTQENCLRHTLDESEAMILGEPLECAVRALAAACDGARTRDGQGFTAFDSGMGRDLASRPFAQWSPKQRRSAWLMLRKYKDQLGRMGMPYDEIPEPPPEPTGGKEIFIRAGLIHVKFPFDPALVAKVRVIHPQRWWDGNGTKDWLMKAQPSQAAAAVDFAARNGFSITEDVRQLADYHDPNKVQVQNRNGRVRLEPDRVVVTFDYDEWITREMQAVTGAVFRKNKSFTGWIAPLTPSAITGIHDVAKKYEFRGDVDQLAAMAGKMTVFMEQSIEASKAESAEIDIPGLGGELMPFQKAGVVYGMGKERCFIADEQGLGKQQPVDTPVLTPDGWRTIGGLRLGDMVIGSSGKATPVRGIFPQGYRPSFRVTFSDGSNVEAGLDHLWTMMYRRGGRRWESLTLTTDQLRLRPVLYRKWKGRADTELNLGTAELYLPMLSGPCQFAQAKDPGVPPYTLGALIANGGLTGTGTQLTINTKDTAEIESFLQAEGVTMGGKNVYGGATRYSLPGLTGKLETLKLFGVYSRDKFIPEICYSMKPESRVALFQGLMDGDGSISKTGNRITFCSTSKRLAADVRRLVQELGGIASINEYDRSAENKPLEFQVRIRLPEWAPPFRIARKRDRYKPGMAAAPCRVLTRVDYVRDVESVCIAVDAPDALYVTKDCILTHNTIEGLAILLATNAFPALIVVIKSVKLNWAKEARKWLPGKRIYIMEGEKSTGPPNADITIINYERVKKSFDFLISRGFKAIIADECQKLKGKGTQQTLAVEQVTLGHVYGFDQDGKINRREKRVVSPPIPIRLFLSGTPIENRPEELIPQLRTLGWLAEVGGERGFQQRFIYSSSGTKDLYNWLRATCFVRRLKSEVLKELPAKQRAILPVPITNRQEYNKAEADLIRWLGQTKGWAKAEAARRAEALVRIGQLKQLAARGKMEAVGEWVESFMEGGNKLVIAAWHHETLDEIHRRFKCPMIHGGVSTAKREQIKEDFQTKPDPRMVALQLKVIGITLTAASDVACVELGWNAAQMDQIEDRCHRIGQQDSVNAWWFVGEKTIDVKIAALIEKKRKSIAAIQDGVDDDGTSILDELIASLLGGESDAITEKFTDDGPAFENEPEPEEAFLF